MPFTVCSAEEIEAYGLQFQEELFTKPFIADWTLEKIFGEKAQYVKDTFLYNLHDDIWEMKPEYDTQRKVEAWYKATAKSDDTAELANLRDGLYALISDVLFVRDRKNKDKFHPRIPTHRCTKRLHLSGIVGQRQVRLQPSLQRLLLPSQQPVLVSGGDEEVA